MLLPSETSIAVAPVLLIGFEGNVNCDAANRDQEWEMVEGQPRLEGAGGTKRPAETEVEELRGEPPSDEPRLIFDALTLERAEVLAVAEAAEGEVHPLVRLQAQAALERMEADRGKVKDHGAWGGDWPLPTRTEYEARVKAGMCWPTGRDALAVQAARKEYRWNEMNDEQRKAFSEAAKEAWDVWVRNEAVEVLSDAEKDADSLPDLSALVVFLGSEQVCVLQGREYVDGARELYIRNLDSKNGSPTLPIGRRLSRILKGVFGLSDAPREKSLTKEGWHASTMDAATFFLWSDESTPRLLGVLRSHVDDLLVAGGPEAWASLERLGTELGCGEISISMKEYHQNLQPIRMAASRWRDMDAVLAPGEAKQLRALVGSLQWLVAQCRIDLGYQLSVLQADGGTVQTVLRANALVKLFKSTADFSLKFKPLDLTEAGILIVTNA
eukprot:s2874_g4.t1